jgi:glycerol kinase
MAVILAIDSSTSSNKVTLIADNCKDIVMTLTRDHAIVAPQPNWAENDAEAVVANLIDLIREAGEKVDLKSVRCIGITNQRETVVAWRKSDSKVLYNAVLWCDFRTREICERIIKLHDGNQDYFKPITGLPISTYFSAFKMLWLLENIPHIKDAHEKGDLCFGNLNTWILWRFSQGKQFLTDCSNASRTFLMDLITLDYSEDLLKIFGIKRDSLPEIRPTMCNFGQITLPELNLTGVPVSCMLGDQQAATFGHGLLTPGLGKNTYGTGAFLMINTGSQLVNCHGMVSSIFYQIEGQDPQYCIEGAIECGANVLNWLKDSMNQFDDFEKINTEIPKINPGVYFLPAVGGLFSPFWENDASSIIYGCTLHTKPSHLFRAALEGIAYRTKDCIECLKTDFPLKELVVDGGITRSDFLLEFQEELINIPLKVSNNPNCTIFGAGIGAAIQQKMLSLDKVSDVVEKKREITISGKWDLSSNYPLWKQLCESSIQLAKFKSKN